MKSPLLFLSDSTKRDSYASAIKISAEELRKLLDASPNIKLHDFATRGVSGPLDENGVSLMEPVKWVHDFDLKPDPNVNMDDYTPGETK